MKSTRGFLAFSKVILVTVFSVILAGGVVRMTQSGMGCPDWPTCFGKWIPPTNADQLPPNYKELYAFKYVDTSFNPYHTWIEYINRLLGALLGVLLMIQLLWSLKFWKTNRQLSWLSFVLLLLTGFQGWLGSKVVEANLEVAKVTAHMIVALVIAALAVTIIYKAGFEVLPLRKGALKNISMVIIVLLLVQIVLGTQVREEIDHISASLDFQHRELWIQRLGNIFNVHRSFALVVTAGCLYLFYRYKNYNEFKSSAWLILACLLCIVGLGLLMAYFNMPAIAQPLHLLLSSVLITLVYYNWLRTSYMR